MLTIGHEDKLILPHDGTLKKNLLYKALKLRELTASY